MFAPQWVRKFEMSSQLVMGQGFIETHTKLFRIRQRLVPGFISLLFIARKPVGCSFKSVSTSQPKRKNARVTMQGFDTQPRLIFERISFLPASAAVGFPAFKIRLRTTSVAL